MAACFWLWLIWLIVLINGLTGWVPPSGPSWAWPQFRVGIHIIFMVILGFLIYKVCGSLTGNLVH